MPISALPFAPQLKLHLDKMMARAICSRFSDSVRFHAPFPRGLLHKQEKARRGASNRIGFVAAGELLDRPTDRPSLSGAAHPARLAWLEP